MGNEYSGARFTGNVLQLMKDRNLKVNEVEKKIGISTGYLSKMLKKGEAANPSILLVWKLANYFDISVERLVDGDVSDVYDNERLLIATMDVCKVTTQRSAMKWETISADEINAQVKNNEKGLPIIGERRPCDPYNKELEKYLPEGVTPACFDNRTIVSHVYPFAQLYVVANGYKGMFVDDKWFHIYKLGGFFHNFFACKEVEKTQEPKFETFYEVWVEDKENEEKPFKCVSATRDANLEVRDSVAQLYDAIDKKKTLIEYDPQLRSFLESVVSLQGGVNG